MCVSDPVNCNDQNGCTDDGCNPQTGCTHTNNNDPCSDGNACTTDDACSQSNCVGGPPPDCNDNNVCTDDSCNPASGCVNTNNSNPCDDGSECTTGDACSGRNCVGGPPPTCDDGNPCTTETCNPTTPGGCVSSNNSDPCDDEDPCTDPDTCANGTCAGQPRNCGDADECTLDSCDGQGGDFLCVRDNCLNVFPVPVPNNPLCPVQCYPPCGNGQIDPGETCEPTGAPQPPNSNPCRIDCTYCGDGLVDTRDGETCDDRNNVSGCNPTLPQQALDACQNDCTQPMCEDPAKIKLASLIDRFDMHGRLTTDSTIDFSSKTFVAELTDSSDQVVFRASLDVGALEGDPAIGTFKFKDKTAKVSGGVGKLKIRKVNGSYRATLQAYGNLYRAEANMVTHVFVQNAEWTWACTWERTNHGWRCTGR